MPPTNDFDEDVTGQIAAVANDPMPDLPAAVRATRLDAIDTRKRIRRMERLLWWLAGSIFAGALGVMTTVASAAYGLGARLTALDALVEHVEAIDERLEQHERLDASRAAAAEQHRVTLTAGQ